MFVIVPSEKPVDFQRVSFVLFTFFMGEHVENECNSLFSRQFAAQKRGLVFGKGLILQSKDRKMKHALKNGNLRNPVGGAIVSVLLSLVVIAIFVDYFTGYGFLDSSDLSYLYLPLFTILTILSTNSYRDECGKRNAVLVYLYTFIILETLTSFVLAITVDGDFWLTTFLNFTAVFYYVLYMGWIGSRK